MNKKKLPKAIRPGAAGAGGAAAHATPEPPPAGAAAPQAGPVSPEERRAVAVRLVERFASWAGAAGFIPVPFLDLATVGGLQVQMLRRLSQIYGVPFSQNRGKALIAGLAGSMIPASSGIGAASLIKGVPILGPTVSAFAMPTLAAGATYAIGMAFIEHFSSGGTLLNFNPRSYRIKMPKLRRK